MAEKEADKEENSTRGRNRRRSSSSGKRRGRKPASEKNDEGKKSRSGYARMNILQGAADVFGRMGYAATRVEDILDAAGISRPTFYRFFRNKDDVFDALDEISHVTLLQLIRSAVLATDDPIQKIEKCVDAFLRWHATTGPVAKILRQEALITESAFSERRGATMERILNFFERESQRIRSEQIDPLLFVGLLAATERIADELHNQHDQITEDDIERGKRIIMRIFYGALADKSDKLPNLPKINDLPRKDRKNLEKQLKEKTKQRQEEEGSRSLWFMDFDA